MVTTVRIDKSPIVLTMWSTFFTKMPNVPLIRKDLAYFVSIRGYILGFFFLRREYCLGDNNVMARFSLL